MLVLAAAGCRESASENPGVEIDVVFDPSPPAVGNSKLEVNLRRSGGTPVGGAEVRVEGNMNHAGMRPSFSDLEEVAPGRYVGMLDFTMGGDWFLLVEAKTGDGETVNGKFDVPGVAPR